MAQIHWRQYASGPSALGKEKEKNLTLSHSRSPSRFIAVAPLTPNMAWHAWQQSHPPIQSFILLESSTYARKPNATRQPETIIFPTRTREKEKEKQGFRVRPKNLGHGMAQSWYSTRTVSYWQCYHLPHHTKTRFQKLTFFIWSYHGAP